MSKQIVATCTSNKKIYQLVLVVTGDVGDKRFGIISSLNYYCYTNYGSRQLKHLPMGVDGYLTEVIIGQNNAINLINSSINTILRKFNRPHVEKVDFLRGLAELLKEEVGNNADSIYQSLEKDFEDGEHPV